MKIEVFSDPVWGLGRADGVSVDDLSDIVLYDEEIVKPALLLSDQVILRSWRLDVQFGVILEGNAVTLGVPLQHVIKGVVDRNSPSELEMLGIGNDLYRDLRALINRYGRKKGMAGQPFFASEAVEQFVRLKMKLHGEQYEALCASRFKPLLDKGVLLESPWDDRPKQSFIQAEYDHRNTAFQYGWTQMVSALEVGDSAVLLDHGIQERLSGEGSASEYRSAVILESATNLMRCIDGLHWRRLTR